MADIYKSFNSIKEFEGYLANGKTQPSMSYESHEGTRSFCKTSNYAEATNLLLYGDNQLRQKIEAMGLQKLKANLNKYVVKRQLYTSVVGFAPHVPNYVANVPNTMINVRMKHIKQNVVTVFYNSAVSGYTEAEDIMEAVSKLCCALVRLEAQGIRVNLYAGTLGEAGRQKVAFSVKVKSSGQPFDTLKMIYPLAHPSFNRRHKFRYVEVTEGVNSKWSYGYGSSETDDSRTRQFLKEHGLNVDHVFNYKSVEHATIDTILDRLLGKTK